MRQKRNLKDVVVDGMALTGSPANGEPFLLYKSADGEKWPEGVEMADDVAGTAELKTPTEAIAKSIRDASQASAGHADAVLLESIGHLLHSMGSIELNDLVSVAKAAGVDIIEKAKNKADEEDEDEEEEFEDDEGAEADNDDPDDDGDDDEDAEDDDDAVEDGEAEGTHPSLPPEINRKANARAKAKKQLRKGGPGSGRYPAGSDGKGDKMGSASSKADVASNKAFEKDSIDSHKAAIAAHEKVLGSKSASDEDKKHSQGAISQHKTDVLRLTQGLDPFVKSLNNADSSAENGGATMPEDIEKSERVDVNKAHRELLQKHEEMVARLEKAETELTEQRKAALLKSVQEQVARELPHLAVNKGELAELIKNAREQQDQSQHDSMMKIFKALNAQAEMSAGGSLFKTSSRTPAFSMGTGDDTKSRLNSMIDARLEKSADSNKTRSDVFLEVMNTPEGRALWAENLQEGRN